jgi:hypothetical protein
MIERGPESLEGLEAGRRALVDHEIAQAFRAAFLTIALFMAGALALSWLNPARRV